MKIKRLLRAHEMNIFHAIFGALVLMVIFPFIKEVEVCDACGKKLTKKKED